MTDKKPNEKYFGCGYCEAVFPDLLNYALHLRDSHPKVYKKYKKDIDREINKKVKQ